MLPPFRQNPRIQRDSKYNPTLRKGQSLMSNLIITKANLKKLEVNFLKKVQRAALKDGKWVYRKEELEYMEKEEEKLPKQ